jgi:hypothetical protein
MGLHSCCIALSEDRPPGHVISRRLPSPCEVGQCPRCNRAIGPVEDVGSFCNCVEAVSDIVTVPESPRRK